MLICKLFCCTLETVIVWPHVCMEMRGNVMPHGIKESRCFKFSGRHDRSVGPKITSRIEAFLHMVALWWHMAALKWQARRQLWRFCSNNVYGWVSPFNKWPPAHRLSRFACAAYLGAALLARLVT